MAQKILYLVSEDWYFVSHRLPMARAARAAGFEVHVATRIAGHAAAIEREGFILHRSEEHTSELQSLRHLVCRLLLEKKKTSNLTINSHPRSSVRARSSGRVRLT